jgi:hypothetical protein
VGALGGTTNIQTIFDLVPRCSKHVWCYRSQSVSYASFQVLKVVDLNLVDNVLHITDQKKWSNWVKSGEVGSQATGPPLPIHLPAIPLLRWFLIWWKKCDVAPSCWRIVWDSNWSSAYSSSMSKYERPVTVFSEKKNCPINYALSCLFPTHMWHVYFNCPKSCSCTCLQLHWHGTSPHPKITLGGGNRVTRHFFPGCPQRSLCVLLGHVVLVHGSFESCTLLGGAFCIAHHALLNVGFVAVS